MKRRELIQKAVEWDSVHGRKAGFLDKIQLNAVDLWLKKCHELEFGVDQIVQQYVAESRRLLRKQYFNKIAMPILFVIFIGFSGFILSLIYGYVLKKEAIESNDLVKIEAGWYKIGSNEKKDAFYYPEWEANLSGFEMERYEVSNHLYCLCQKAGYCPEHTYGQYNVCDAEGDEPVSDLIIENANRYCEWIGRRLPTELEWEAAARTKNNYTYPTKNNEKPNPQEVNILPEHHENGVSKKKSIYLKDISSLGIYGLAGNVAEWTVSTADKYCTKEFFLYQEAGSFELGKTIVIKGSSADSIVDAAKVFDRGSIISGRTDGFIGFRCVKSELQTTLKERRKCHELAY